MRAEAVLAVHVLVGCSAVTDFAAVGLPCEVDEHCPDGTVCGGDGECVEGGTGGGGGSGPVGGGGFPTSVRILEQHALPQVGAPVGLTFVGGALFVADFVDDRIATTAGATV